jgi:hypothetical protein
MSSPDTKIVSIRQAEPRTRAQWARRINEAHKTVVGACLSNFLKLGRELLAAKRALPHGEFTPMIESDLNFTARTAQTLMRVARDKRLAKSEAASHLPKALTVLHELTRLPDEAIERGVSAGIIHPEMTRSAAKQFVTITTVDKTERVVALVQPASKPKAKPFTKEMIDALNKGELGDSCLMQQGNDIDIDAPIPGVTWTPPAPATNRAKTDSCDYNWNNPNPSDFGNPDEMYRAQASRYCAQAIHFAKALPLRSISDPDIITDDDVQAVRATVQAWRDALNAILVMTIKKLRTPTTHQKTST